VEILAMCLPVNRMSWGCFPRYCLRTAVRLSSALASSNRGNGE